MLLVDVYIIRTVVSAVSWTFGCTYFELWSPSPSSSDSGGGQSPILMPKISIQGRWNFGRSGKMDSQSNSTSGIGGKSQMMTLSPPGLQCGHQITGTMVWWPSLEVVYQMSEETPEMLVCCVETPGGNVVIVEVTLDVVLPLFVVVGTLMEVVLPSMFSMPELARETV